MRRRFFWKLFLTSAIPLIIVWAVCAAVLLNVVNPDLPQQAAPASRPEDVAHDTRPYARRVVLVMSAVGLPAALLLAGGMAAVWNRRVATLAAAADALARGEFATPLDSSGRDELAALARALNRMMERVPAQLAALEQRRSSLESILDAIDEAVVVVRRDGRIMMVNPAGKRLLGLTASTADGGMTVEQCIPQHDLQRLLLQGPDGSPKDGSARIEVNTPHGPVSVLARACDIPLPEDGARRGSPGPPGPTGRLLVLSDVSEQSRAARLRTDFVANASHELRTPLSTVRAAAETLLEMDLAADREAATRFVETIARHTARLESLVADLLDLSRLESPSGRFEATAIPLSAFFDEVHARWAENARRKGVRFECEVGADCATLPANSRLLGLVVDNLLDNAVKFTDPGGNVRLSAVRDGEAVRIEVRDTGCGIAAEEHERVFERFYQASASRRAPAAADRGTGLGLSIVKHAVAGMSGRRSLESAPGRGTTVSVTLPGGD